MARGRRECAIFVLIIVIGVIICEDVVDNEETSEDNGSNREVREFDQERWRAVENFHENDQGWIPRDDIQETDQIKPKRRRLRKRKRRPPIQENSEEVQFTRRRVRPYRLEPWQDINEDEIKPNVRRRLPQPYQSSEEVKDETSSEKIIFIKENPPNTQEKPLETSIFVEDRHDQPVTQNSLTDLKNLLKKAGGQLSLSEILQQKNLSLSELLKGNEKAISALTERSQHTVPMTESTTELTTKYKRLPPSIGLKKDKNISQDDEKLDTLSEKETLEAQRKRLMILQPKENKIYASIIKFDVITEPTTERRIFVPAGSKYLENEYKPPLKINNFEIETTTEQKPTSTSKSTPSSATTIKELQEKTTVPSTTPKLARSRLKLPTTNAKLKLTTKRVSTGEKEPLPSSDFIKPIKININEVVGFPQRNSEKRENIVTKKDFNTEGPMRISIDLDVFDKNGGIPLDLDNLDNTSKKPFITETKPIYKETKPETNETYVTAKQEIMEVMKDPASREKLSRILEHRNMTLQELVEQRERGSSQRHLADIFHNNTREPEPKEEPHVGHISAEFFNNLHTTNRQQKSTKLDDVSTPVSTTVSSITTDSKATTTVKEKEVFPTVAVNFENQALETFPWKQLYPDLFPEPKEESPKDDINEIINRDNIESSYTANLADDNFFSNIPSGVKSALFVSLAIVALSILVFLAILVIFKWLQKKNRSLNYCSSLTTKFRPPVLQGRPTTAIKTFMNETLGRKKNYYKSSLQSMSDEIWDGKKDRKESF